MPDSAETPTPILELQTSRQFTNFLAEQQVSLAVTTYQAGKLPSVPMMMIHSPPGSLPLRALKDHRLNARVFSPTTE